MIAGNCVMFACLFISMLGLIGFSFGLAVLGRVAGWLIRLGTALGRGVLGWLKMGARGDGLISIISLSLIKVGILLLVAIN